MPVSENGRWIVQRQKKRRRSPRALRFANIKVGDQLVCRQKSRWETYERRPVAVANEDPLMKKHDREVVTYAVVTDLWFDPVRGEHDPVAGQMVAVKFLREGLEVGSKQPHTRRRLAMNGYNYADFDVIGHWRRLREAVAEGEATPFTRGKEYRLFGFSCGNRHAE